MTENDWLTTKDVSLQLRILQARNQPLSARQRRLFVCGLARQAWDTMADCRSYNCVTAGEIMADGEILESERAADLEEAIQACQRNAEQDDVAVASSLLLAVLCGERNLRLDAALAAVSLCLDEDVPSRILREIVGNPFRPGPLAGWTCVCGHRHTQEPWRSCAVCVRAHPWLTPQVLSLAEQAYAQQDWAVLPILADALEDAGCTVTECLRCHGAGIIRPDEEPGERPFPGMVLRGCPRCTRPGDDEGSGFMTHPVLTHLRGKGPHVRGCWVLDALLGRQDL